ncbi:type I-E CRISPR-associated protein Cas7/Cse4/CasC [Quadrisphaera sp. DSM 44207]|uniref:type I-E CRISPR-associated protein Cas7/Cse4/CasC n=1 Tax=Quadrisphaera sp. DSM 44207 TaxID=1881057 RepID=UPI00088D9AF9|nr:type I-E CRISPR-associated protein Cas7/Cse4/CasC [Quadrisphaera sp. DSM 44207]SDQ03921.1 CRISPR-associated protein, Cse4 family [Quadrisphaera sp. DSM 44207]
MTARYIDIHVLQTVPFSNLNRDDLGSPKALTYGAVQRLRVSSQCWKRATREHMQRALQGHARYDRAIRTRRPFDILTTHLTDAGWSREDATHAAEVVFAPYKDAQDASGDAADGEVTGSTVSSANVLLFLTESQYADLAAIVTTHRGEVLQAVAAKGRPSKKDGPELKKIRAALSEVIKSPRGLVTVFGRMIAALPTANVEGGVQVAHAFTVHQAAAEFDYFTAVDDYTQDENTGAGHLGAAEFATGTFYRYATVDLEHLTTNTGDPALAHDLAAQFISSFVSSLPSGKSTATAPNTRPNLVVVQVREDQPLSYAAAFERAVTYDGQGYLLPAVHLLTEHATLIADAYGDSPVWSGHLNAVTTDPDQVKALNAAFGDRVSGGPGALATAALASCDLAALVREPVA